MEGYRLKKYLGAYAAALGTVDAIVFTAGVGERGPITRAKCLEGLESLGIVMDPKKNEMSVTRNAETEITGKGSKVRIFVIPTDEELVMTEDTYALLEGTYDIHTNFTYSFQDPRLREQGPRGAAGARADGEEGPPEGRCPGAAEARAAKPAAAKKPAAKAAKKAQKKAPKKMPKKAAGKTRAAARKAR